MMRAVVRNGLALTVKDVAEPVPGNGQVLLRTLACGICGSDLHALEHGGRRPDLAKRTGIPSTMDASRDIVFGHEFCGEILAFGPQTRQQLAIGTRVVALPIAFGAAGYETIGYSHNFPGGFGERMVATEDLLIPVPDHVTDEQAAMVEPFAVGLHAVNAADTADAGILVVGCGPVGLAVIAALKLKGHTRIAASDYSPARRRVAAQLGATLVLDPAVDDVASCWKAFDVPMRPAPHVPRQQSPVKPRRGIVFECVGVPGVIERLIAMSPVGGQIVVVGVCQEQDHFEPLVAILKQIELKFVLGYSHAEFEDTLSAIADERIDLRPVITGRIALSQVAEAFRKLTKPESDVKIVVCPAMLD